VGPPGSRREPFSSLADRRSCRHSSDLVLGSWCTGANHAGTKKNTNNPVVGTFPERIPAIGMGV
jgi:hypothetical protein